MFDERHLQLSSSYVRISEHFHKEVIKPLRKFIFELVKSEWNERAKIELAQETYVLKLDDDGGYSWAKLDPKTNELFKIVNEEQQELEEIIESSFSSVKVKEDTKSQSLKEQKPIIPEIISLSTQSEKLSPLDRQNNITPPSSPNTVDITVEVIDDITPQLATSQFFTLQPAALQPAALLPPDHIEQRHWEELVVKSAISPAIVSANFKSLYYDSVEQCHEAWEYLLYSDQIERKNAGRITDKTLSTYAFLDSTDGWWCDGGIDPRSFPDLQPGEEPHNKLWGCYKPDQPRPDTKKPDKFVKYEHPYKSELSIFLLEVPDSIAQLVYTKAGVNPSESDLQSGFWYSVWKHNIPVTITEGAKKAASVLSCGEAAIGLPGINGAYTSKNEFQERILPLLRPEIAMFATKDREVKICFDHDIKSKTVYSVNNAISKTGQLFTLAGAEVKVISLPGPEKGIDDFIVANGQSAFHQLSSAASPIDTWRQNNPPPDLRFVIFLRNGQELKLYQQKGSLFYENPDSSSKSEITLEDKIETSIVYKEKPSYLFRSLPKVNALVTVDQTINALSNTTSNSVEPSNKDAIDNSTNAQTNKEDDPSLSWVKREQATVYQNTISRKLVEKEQNSDIALAARESSCIKLDSFITSFGSCISIMNEGDRVKGQVSCERFLEEEFRSQNLGVRTRKWGI